MASQFLLQIIERNSGKIVTLEPGGPVEVELVAELAKRLQEKRVGIFTTRAQVAKVVEDTLKDMIYELKRKI